MKKLFTKSISLFLVIVLSFGCFSLVANAEETIYYSDLFYKYDPSYLTNYIKNYKDNNFTVLTSVYNTYLDSEECILTAIKTGINTGTDLKSTIKFLADCFGADLQHNDALKAANLKFVQKMFSEYDTVTSVLGADKKIVKNANSIVKAFKALFEQHNAEELNSELFGAMLETLQEQDSLKIFKCLGDDTTVENITLKGYKITNCGNFMHQLDNCQNITMQSVTCEGGSDGVHLHHCRNTLIEDCIFHTGDDNIAGINMENLTVRRCDLNTSCDTFRVGGSHILVEDCKIWGPGIYPHRMTVVQNRGSELVRNKSNTLPQNMGRHNLECVFIHFASKAFPSEEPYHDIVFKNCNIDNVDKFLSYQADVGGLMIGAHLVEMTLKNVSFTNLKGTSWVSASKEEPLTVTIENVNATDVDGRETNVFDENDDNLIMDIKKQ